MGARSCYPIPVSGVFGFKLSLGAALIHNVRYSRARTAAYVSNDAFP